MKQILLLAVLLVGCASAPLTPLEKIEREMHEQERVENFHLWREWCRRHGIMQVYNSWTCSLGRIQRGCVPSKYEWDFVYRDMPDGTTQIRVISSTYACVSRSDIYR